VQEIKTDTCHALERAIHSVLESRDRKVIGGGSEEFRTTRDEFLATYKFISDGP
jgi:hypothetical protein